jgi:hypothetical protein
VRRAGICLALLLTCPTAALTAAVRNALAQPLVVSQLERCYTVRTGVAAAGEIQFRIINPWADRFWLIMYVLDDNPELLRRHVQGQFVSARSVVDVPVRGPFNGYAKLTGSGYFGAEAVAVTDNGHTAPMRLLACQPDG